MLNCEVVQLVKDFTTQHTRGAVEFDLDTNSVWKYKIIKRAFKSGKKHLVCC